MKVLIISAAYPPDPGGVATHVANLTHGLLKLSKDHFVNVLTAKKDPRTFPSDKKGRLNIWKLGMQLIPNFYGRRAPMESPIGFLMERWDQIKADIIHAHDLDSAYIGFMLKVAFNIPLVLTVHRAPIKWKDYAYRESPKDCFMESIKLYRLADHLIVPSKTSREVLLDQGFSRRRISVIPHGINYKYLSSFTNLPDVLESLKLADDSILVLCPVRADEHKDPATFIRGAASLKQQNPDKKFTFLLTDNPSGLYSDLPFIAAHHGLNVETDIIFRSFEYSEMPTLYRRANLCVVPSNRESFGQTVLEAFVFYTPVVAANAAALGEIVAHNKTGLLFRANSPDDLAYQMHKILQNQELARSLKKNGFKDVKDKFNVNVMVNEYGNLYERVINKPIRK